MCVGVTIVNDDCIVEKEEMFDVVLERTSSLDSRITIHEDRRRGVVNITDNDSMHSLMF